MQTKIFKILKPGDYIVIFFIFCFFFINYSISFFNSNYKNIVEIIDYKKKVYLYSINNNSKIDITGPHGITEIKIENGNVWVQKASCPYKVCKQMGAINNVGEMIICVPNRILIRIKGNKYELDGISR